MPAFTSARARAPSVVFVPPYRVASVSVTSPEPSVKAKERRAFFWALAVELVLSLLMTMREKTMARAAGDGQGGDPEALLLHRAEELEADDCLQVVSGHGLRPLTVRSGRRRHG